MTLDEAIKHAEEVARQNEADAIVYSNCKKSTKNLYEIGVAENAEKNCCKCAEEHRQLAEWLIELKRLREQTEKRTEERTKTHACDCISRQAAIDALDVLCQEHRYRIPGKRETYSQYNEAWQDALDRAEGAIFNLPSAQPEQTDCEYCHEDADAYVRPIEKNSHAWLVRRGRTMKLRIGFKGEYRECDILFCPMCGRELKHG